jgi:hypothetical protein
MRRQEPVRGVLVKTWLMTGRGSPTWRSQRDEDLAVQQQLKAGSLTRNAGWKDNQRNSVGPLGSSVGTTLPWDGL